MKIITLDSFGTPKDYTCVNSDDSTYNYFEEKISPSEFSDIELEVFEIIDEMEMPDSISNIFNEAMNYFSDTPLYDVPQNMKKETLSWLLLFSQWQEKEVNKFSEISSRCFPRAKHNLLQKILTHFTRMLIIICNLQNIKLQLKNFLLNTKLLRTNQFTKATMTLNIQNKILTEIDERIDKETVQLLDKISLGETLSASGRGKIRYIGGYVVAKPKYRNSKLLRNCLFVPGKDQHV